MNIKTSRSTFVLYVLCSVLPHCRSFIPNVVLYDRKGNETWETIFDVSVENKTCPCVNRKDEVKSTKEITCLLPHVFEIDPQAQVTWRNVRHYHIQNYCNRNDLKSTDFKGIVHAKQWTLAGNVLTFRPSKCHVRWVSSSDLLTSDLILSIRRRLKLCRAPETPRAPFALKDDFILVSLLNLAGGYENMNDHYCNAALSPFPRKISLLLETKKRVESTASRRRDNVSRVKWVSFIRS